jgi:nucleoside-diphosphate-sugar epimerase
VAKKDRNEFETQKSNIDLQIRLAERAKSLNTETFIAFGSQAEFSPSVYEIQEIEAEHPVTAYGLIKSELHSKLATIFAGSKTRFIWARIFSVYGPLDKSDSLINGIISSMLDGSTLEIIDPDIEWSFLHEQDFSEAITLIIRKTSLEGIINIGNPDLISLGDIPTLLNCNKILLRKNQSGENTLRLKPATEKLNNEGWSAKVEFRNGITDIIKYRQHLNPEASK